MTLKAIRDLRAQGYQQVTEEDDGIDRAVTSIGYGPGHQADAERLARLFPGADVRADSESTTVTITLGTDYATALAAAGPSSTPNASPGTVPGGIAQNTRPADADACSGLSYG